MNLLYKGVVGMLDEAAHAPTDGDFVEFAVAGTTAEGEYHCSACGYGVSVHQSLPACPMCAGTTWEPVEFSGFARQRYQA